MKKRFLRTALMLVLIFCSTAAWAEKQMYARLSGSTLTFYYNENKTDGDYLLVKEGWNEWGEKAESITHVIFDSSFVEARPTSTLGWFSGFTNLQSIEGISYLNTSNVTNMGSMFWMCSSLKNLDVSNFDTGNVTSMLVMFYGCSNLTSLDVSNFNTSKVRDMNSMFEGCRSLASLDVSNFNTDNVEDLGNMFLGCNSLTSLNVSNFNTSNVENVGNMFCGCNSLTGLEVSNFNTNKVTSMRGMFNSCSALTSLDVSNFNTSNVTDMSSMFDGCSSLTKLDLMNFDFSTVSNISMMFNGCQNLGTIYCKADLSGVESGENVFGSCTILEGSKGTSYVYNSTDKTYARPDKEGQPGYFADDINYVRKYMYVKLSGTGTDKTMTFYYDNDKENADYLVSNSWEVSWNMEALNVTHVIFDSSFADARPATTAFWFNDFENLQSIDGISYLNTSNVTNMAAMFQDCVSLTTLDLSSFDTQNVTNMGAMFNHCNSLTTLNVSNFDTSNVTDMSHMFSTCSSLTSLDVSNFNTENVTKAGDMFTICSSLTSLDVSNFNTGKITDMVGMFHACSSLTSLDVSHFNTSNVTDMYHMFEGCSSLESLNLLNFDFNNVTNISRLFAYCSALETVYCKADLSGIESGENVFYRCNKLVGNNGTSFNSSHVDKTYARPDKDGLAGYFVEDANYVRGNVGTTFTAETTEGIEVLYTILSDNTNSKTCQVGYMEGDWNKTAIDGNSAEGIVTIPDEVNGYKVVKVGQYAFYNAYRMTSVVLPQTVTEIENYAFANCGLTKFVLPKSVTRIGQSLFLYCGDLTSLTVEDGNPIYSSPEGSNVIIETAAKKVVTGLTHATIPSGVTSIGEAAFLSVSGAEITIPSTVTTIEDQAFASMYNSTIFVEGKSPIAINESVFLWGSNNYLRVPEGTKAAYLAATGWSTFGEDNILEGREGETFTATTTEGVEVLFTILSDKTNSKTCQVGYFDGSWDKSAVVNQSNNGAITIPEEVNGYKVVKVGRYAFYNAYSMTSVVLPQTITAIEDYAFFRCSQLGSFMLPKGVTSLGNFVFLSCGNLTSLSVEDGNPIYSSSEGSNVIIETAANKVVIGSTHATIPSGVTSIGDNVFNNVNGGEISIPSTVTTIGNQAFANMYNSTVTVEWDAPIAIDESVFRWSNNNYLRVPEGTKTAYQAATGWSTFGEDHILEGRIGETFTVATTEGVEVLYTILSDNTNSKTCQVGYMEGEWNKTAIDGNSVKGAVTIPDEVNGYKVVKVGKYAFYNAYRMTSVVLPQTVTEIENYAFANCGLTKFVLPKSVTRIGQSIFQFCSGLTSLTVEGGNPVFSSPEGSNVIIETAAKKVVTGLTHVTIPSGVTSIGESAFYNVNGAEITIPSTVTTIEDQAFASMYYSTIIVKAESPIAINESVFQWGNNNYLRVPEGAKTAYLAATGWSTFGEDHILEGRVGETFTAATVEGIDVLYTIIDDHAKTCQVGYLGGYKKAVEPGVSSDVITIPEEVNGYQVVKVGEAAFYMTSLKSVVLPQTVTEIEAGAFGYSELQSFVLPKSVTKLGICVFQSCGVNPLTVEEGNPVFSSPEGSNVIIETASKKVVTGARKATIPAGVTSIGERAFFGMNYGEFSIPSTVTTIEDEAFTANYNSSVTVEWQSPIAVGENVIDGRDGSNLFVPVGTKAAYLAATGWSTFGDDHIIECTAGQTFTAKTLEAVDVAYTILDTDAKECQVGYIDGNEDNVAVNRETQTFRITIPESIGGYTVAEIGQYAFQGVMAESVVIPQTVTAIGEYAFAGCTGLTAIYSHSVEPIPLGSAEAKVRTRAGGEDISASTVFAQVDKEACILFVPNGSVDSYKNAPGWGEFTHIRPMLVEGDVTGDSIIDEADFAYVEKCIMGGIADPKADLNKDGKVNAADLVTLANLKLYGQTTPPSTK